MAEVFKNVRVPGPNDNVYKDECVYSFDNPESENGLFVCMSTFYGYGKDHVARHCKRNPTKNVFLHILRRRKPIPVDPNVEPVKVTKLAIGIEGGFDVNGPKRYAYEEKYSIYIHPDRVIPYPEEADQLPDHVRKSAEAIIAADSAFLKEERALLNATWNGEVRRVSKHAATLKQLDNGRRIPPNGWKCEKCDLKDNLWLNLTDGSILCGRKFYDGTGGNNHAVEHYYQTRFPLAVKLGTITSTGADVYSYDEDDMVEDPNLAIHLSHWGINMMKMEKTDRSMADLEIELNQKFGEASMIEEANSKLTPVYGAGYTGIKNLGNSCYLNSVMQVLFTIKDFQDKYYKHCDFYFDRPIDPVHDFNTQTAKLSYGLLSGLYSRQIPADMDPSLTPPSGIRPQMFRSLIGKGHHEFGTKRQQDAAEFLEYFIEQVHKHCLTDPTPDAYLDPSNCFQFQLEERLYCPSTNQVRYMTRDDTMFRLNVPLDAAKNMHEVLQYNKQKEEMEKQGKLIRDLPVVRPIVPLTQSIARWAEPEVINGFRIRSNDPPTTIRKTQRFLTFPDYLLVQMKKYTFNDDWTPRKIDVSLDIPDELDLNSLRATGLQHGETPMPEDEPTEAAVKDAGSEQKINEQLLEQLMNMGFSENGCKRALFHTGNNSAEAAMNWIFEHESDPDFNAPFELPSGKDSTGPSIDEEKVALVMSMGFSRPHAMRALTMTNNNVEAAVDWACGNSEDNAAIQTLIESLPQSPSNVHSTAANISTKLTHFRDGAGKYRLVAFISHIGSTTSAGHYVAHILKDGRWVIFNDEAVALSEHPPKDLAYLYLYKRSGQ